MRVGILLAALLIAIGEWARSTSTDASQERVTSIERDLGRLRACVEAELRLPEPAIGTIAAFAGPIERIPNGWLYCDGSILSNTEVRPNQKGSQATHTGDFSKLVEVLGDYWGDGGDGTGPKVNLPDLRGMFLRGADGDKRTDVYRLDPGDATKIRTAQAQATHLPDELAALKWSTSAGDESAGLLQMKGGRLLFSRLEKETRPKNAAVNWVIKY